MMKNAFKNAVFVVVALGVMALSACGFRPLYGSGSVSGDTMQAALNDVAVDNISDREGQMLRNALIDRFYRNGRPADPRYSLAIAKITETLTDLDISKSADTTRAQLRLSTSMVLTDRDTGAVVLTRSLSAVTSYNILASQFTTRVSEESARENALNDLARQVEQQTTLYLNRR